jgi:hypothetical protein
MNSNVHHKRPRSRGGRSDNRNCCKVDSKRHYAWHVLFGNKTGDEIMEEINTLWLDPDYEVVKKQ